MARTFSVRTQPGFTFIAMLCFFLLYLPIATLVVSPLFALVASRWPRQTFVPWLYRAIAVVLLVFWVALTMTAASSSATATPEMNRLPNTIARARCLKCM